MAAANRNKQYEVLVSCSDFDPLLLNVMSVSVAQCDPPNMNDRQTDIKTCWTLRARRQSDYPSSRLLFYSVATYK